MNIFYAPYVSGEKCILDERESRHCIKVLRHRKSDSIIISDGKGGLFEAVIENPDPAACVVKITGTMEDKQARTYYLHLAVSPLKNPERLEWLIEKCVEIGVDEITPVICSKTEKKTVRMDRAEGIIISAMKQSLKARKTIINKPEYFADFISSFNADLKLIAHCYGSNPRKSVREAYNNEGSIIFLIGPEGDFTLNEIESALQEGYIPVHLGSSRLRTETAGIAACHSIYLLNQC